MQTIIASFLAFIATNPIGALGVCALFAAQLSILAWDAGRES